MRVLTCFTLFAALLLSVIIGAPAQSPSNQTSAGSITGRVTITGQPAPGVKVAAQLSSNLQRSSLAEAVTDEEGRYQLMGLAAGNYIVMTLAPGFAPSDAKDPRSPGPTVSLTDGQTVKDLDFALVRGGVITGRVTDADGKPIIRERLNLLRLDARGQKLPFSNQTLSQSMFQTDDRGSYRIYGLPAGSYLVSVGRTGEYTYSSSSSGVYYPRTFYPGVTDEAQAKTIELKPGDEAAKIDITIGRTVQAYSVFGRIVDSATGQPISKGQWGFSEEKAYSQARGQVRFSSPINAQGEFRQPGLLPGRYIFRLMPLESDYYSEPVTVEITNHDITNLEIKAQRGASISGVVTIEGRNDPAARALISQARAWVAPASPGLSIPLGYFPIKADGSFTLTGLPPGRIGLGIFLLNEFRDQLLRLERNGVIQTNPHNAIQVAPAEQITGVRLVMADDKGRVRGKVEITGGELPAGVRLRVTVSPANSTDPSSTRSVEVSAHGDFVIENLKSGGYALILRPVPAPGAAAPTLRLPITGQNIFVASGAETKVTLVLDVRAKEDKP